MSDIFDLNDLMNGRPGAGQTMAAGLAAAGLAFETVGHYREAQYPRISGTMPAGEYLATSCGETEWVEGGLILSDALISDRYGMIHLRDRDLWLAGDAVNQLGLPEVVPPPLPGADTVQHFDRALLIGGRGAATYGHWLLDFVPQILTARAMERQRGEKLPYLMINYTPFGRRFLQFLGIEDRCIFIKRDTPVQIDELWLPLITKRMAAYSVTVLRRGYAHLLKTATATGRLPQRERLPRLLVARTKPPFCTNFEALQAALEPRGFTVVHPEKFPYRQQFQLFHNAEIVVGEDGSAMHNAGFCKPGTPIVVFSRAIRGEKTNWWHGAVAQVADAPLIYLQSRVTGPKSYEAPVDEILAHV